MEKITKTVRRHSAQRAPQSILISLCSLRAAAPIHPYENRNITAPTDGNICERSNDCNGVRSDFENVTIRNVKWTESGQKAVTNRYGVT
jgi:hypothetical protein